MLNSELSEQISPLYFDPMFWLKILEIVLAVVICPIFVSFDQTASVHMKHTSLYYNISLQFPYKYTENITVVVPTNLPLGTLNFAPTLLPSAILFVVGIGLALVVAIVIVSCYIVFRRNSNGQGFIIRYFFGALAVVFVLLISNTFWVVNLVRMKVDVNDKIQSVIDNCVEENANCVDSFPNYTTLYISTTFAILLTVIWSADAILTYVTVAHTIPKQIQDQNNLVPNIELSTSEHEVSTN